jgi:alpha-1,6-mannosyltransferase
LGKALYDGEGPSATVTGSITNTMASTVQTESKDPATDARLAQCRRLGLGGSIALLIGGVFAGIPPKSEPILQHPDLRELRAFITPTAALVYAGLFLLMVAWWRLGRLVRSPAKPTERELLITFAWWGAPLLLGIPIFSTDVYSYIAQGTMTVLGVDAYQHGPSINGQWATDVPPIWHTTPAPYGPVFLSMAAGVAEITGGSAWIGVLGMRALALLGISLIIVATPRLSRLAGVDPVYGLWLAVLNPVVLVHFVGDAHNDALMVGLMMAGLTLALERRPAAGAVLVTLGALIKVPAGYALLFIVAIWASQLVGRWRYPRAALAVGAIAGGTTVITTALAETGYGWVGALNTPTMARTWTSITNDLGYLTGMILERIGIGSIEQSLAVWGYLGLGTAGIICVLMLRRHRANPVLGVGIGLAAVVFLAPVFHPWYMLWATVPLGAASTSPRVRQIVTGLVLLMTILVFPGGIQANMPAIIGLVLGSVLVLAATWAAANLDRADLPGSARAALRDLAPPALLRRLRDAWRVPKAEGTNPAAEPVSAR